MCDSSSSLLKDWIEHDDLNFHFFAPDEATQIRQSLLTWYDKNRRKLPWRGDPPPWEGSTADFANNKRSNEGNKRKNQKKINDFFQTSTKKSTKAEASASETQEDLPTFPVTPYGVWVSEIMLQQTRVEAVVPYWVRWMKSFPTVTDLAQATEEEVNAHFAGLGFYRRARLLHQACQYLVKENNGVMPTTSQELLDLPGVGRYTACAIASIAFNEKVAVVDGNVCRVLSRLRGIANQIKAPAMKDKYGWDLAQQLIEAGDGSRPGDVNQAIMELGATYCAPSGTGTDPDDPLIVFYWSTQLGKEYISAKQNGSAKLSPNETKCPVCIPDGIAQAFENMDESFEKQGSTVTDSIDIRARQCGHAALPLAPPKPARREEVLAVAVLSTEDGSYLMVKRPPSGLLAGQWEFPATCVWTSEGRVADGQVPDVAPNARRKALNSLLTEIFTDSDKIKLLPHTVWQHKRRVQDTTAEHVFSHVRHTMWIENKKIPTSEINGMVRKWEDSTGRQIQWMNEQEMARVGITSGVKKILKVIGTQQSPRAKKQRTK